LEKLTEPQVYELLERYGIETPKWTVVRRGEEGKLKDWQLFPAVVKVVSRKVTHKSDSGGVLFVNDERELREAVEQLFKKFPQGEGVIVEEKLSGIEAFVGAKRDRSFGHLIAVGLGGVLIELFKDATFVPLSATEEETLKALKRTKLYRLIEGFRSYKGNLQLFLQFLQKLKKLLRENPLIYELDLNPTFVNQERVAVADGRAVLKEPEERREFRPLSLQLFNPKSVAVIGASKNPKKVGYALLRNLEEFKGKLYPVNPKYEEILGLKCYPSVKAVPEPVDCAVVAVPAPVVPQVVKECGEKGVKLVVVVSAGFKESGNEELERKVVEIARNYGTRILGPNTLGFIVPRLKLNASFSTLTPREGEVAFLSQSGALITAVIDAAVENRVGFSLIVSLGNQADVEITETVELATREPRTKVVLSYVEGLELGEELLPLLKRKPCVFIKAGRSEKGQRAAASHTGSLAGNYKTFKDAVECKGGVVVDSLEEAFDAVEFLKAYGRIEGKGLIIITNAGGPGTLSADYADTLGLKLAPIEEIKEELSAGLPPNWSHINPIDLLGDATSDRYRFAFKTLEKLDNWDCALVIATPQSMTDFPEIAQEVVKFRNRSQRAVVACFMGGHSVKSGKEVLKEAGVPVYPDPFRAVKAIRRGVWKSKS